LIHRSLVGSCPEIVNVGVREQSDDTERRQTL
jgi:hypothetical protein